MKGRKNISGDKGDRERIVYKNNIFKKGETWIMIKETKRRSLMCSKCGKRNMNNDIGGRVRSVDEQKKKKETQ